ncbi:hypothetical protein KIPE111705_19240 [Kibdelosporangium persicum]|uniref:tRNA nuclease CdiA C-terminal domain-containing protein n=1 Tax=Kibdelosporangium persicum TaxID=2698649 RepID=A0ABX2FBT5_9PSEU|nr:hypothetical protein [Kibdelosporangium persicum]NRN68342.1 hypothetical protein [Kibdelosporangium persicum]
MRKLLFLLVVATRFGLHKRPPGGGGDGPGKPPDGEGTGKPGDPGSDPPPQKSDSGAVDASAGLNSALGKTEDFADKGEPGAGQGKPGETPTTPSSMAHTRPSGQPDPNATPGGTPTDTSTGHRLQREGHQIENDSAVILARAGYKISQNTGEKGNSDRSDPDYNMEGKLWDCYAPRSDKRDSVRSELREKVKEQSGSIVINMARSPMTIEEIKALLPHVKGLEEVKIIDKNGTIIDAFPQ